MEEKLSTRPKGVIILTGPESTGKSTLAKDLSLSFKGKLIVEYARGYIEKLNRSYTYSDLLKIARKQINELRNSLQNTQGFIFSDTYLIITKIWFIWAFNKYPNWIDEEIAKTKPHLYLLCKPDIAWVSDNVRENRGEDRLKLYKEYIRELEFFQLNYAIIEGVGDNRKRIAQLEINTYFNISDQE